MKTSGITISIFIGGHCLHYVDLKYLYLVTATFPLIVVLQAVLFYNEPCLYQNGQIDGIVQEGIDRKKRSFWRDFRAVKAVLTHPDVFYPLMVLVFFNLSPNINHGIRWFVIDI